MLRPALAQALTLLLSLTACAVPMEEDDQTLPWDGEGESIEVDDAKADAAGEIRVRARAMTVWVRPVLEPREDGTFVIRGRASRNLGEAFSFVPDDAFGTTRILSARTFEVALGPHEASTLMFGLPLFVSLTPATAPEQRVTVLVAGRARFAQISGARSIWLVSTLRPVYVDAAVVYRATIGATGAEQVRVGEVVASLDDDGRGFHADIPFDTVSGWAHSGETLAVTAGSATKTALAQLVLARVEITDRDAYDAWPPLECRPETLACLVALDGATDTASCGDAYPVTRCLGALEESASYSTRFADDLRAHLEGWYARYGADVIASGGNDLAAARAAVDVSQITEVTDASEDPFGHDLATTVVVRHPDVAFPGSDRVWFGAYERSTGTLVEVIDFE